MARSRSFYSAPNLLVCTTIQICMTMSICPILLLLSAMYRIVDEFVYLGSAVSHDWLDESDVKRRKKVCIMPLDRFVKKMSIFFPKNRLQFRGKVYCCFILPILLYGVECLSLTQKFLNKLLYFNEILTAFYKEHVSWIYRSSTDNL